MVKILNFSLCFVCDKKRDNVGDLLREMKKVIVTIGGERWKVTFCLTHKHAEVYKAVDEANAHVWVKKLTLPWFDAEDYWYDRYESWASKNNRCVASDRP